MVPRQRGRNRQDAVRLCLPAAAGLAGVALLLAGSAFTAGPQVGRNAGLQAVQLRSAASPPSAWPAASARFSGASTNSTWHLLGSAVLLAASATAVRAFGNRGAAKSGSIRVIGCQPSASLHTASAAPPPRAAAPARAEPVAVVTPSLLDTPTIVVNAPQTTAPVAEFFIGAAACDFEESSETSAGVRRKPARFVGGARRAETQSPRTTRTARAAHRSVGARLLPACEHHVIELPYDPSRTRIHIQLGLRSTSRVRSDCPLECKNCTSAEGSSPVASVMNVRFLVQEVLRLRDR